VQTGQSRQEAVAAAMKEKVQQPDPFSRPMGKAKKPAAPAAPVAEFDPILCSGRGCPNAAMDENGEVYAAQPCNEIAECIMRK